jgi:hypothetical protein
MPCSGLLPKDNAITVFDSGHSKVQGICKDKEDASSSQDKIDYVSILDNSCQMFNNYVTF